MPGLWVPFEDDVTEADYRSYRVGQIVPFERLAALAGSASIIVLVLWDAQVDRDAVSATIQIRLGMAVLLLVFFALTYTPLRHRHLLLQLLSTLILLAGFSWVLAVVRNGFTVGVAGLTMALVLLPLVADTLRTLLVVMAAAVAAPNLFMLIVDADRFTFTNVNVWLAVSAVLAVAFWAVLDRVNRRLFLAERRLAAERERADALLRNILPEDIAERLKRSDASVSARYGSVTVLFADLVGFTAYARDRDPDEIVSQLNGLFSRFDDLVTARGLEKIKTIGDGYMAAGGVPRPRPDHAAAVADLGLAMLETLDAYRRRLGLAWEMRIGVHSGPVVAGVIGKRKFAYDLWGDAVNVASRLETTGRPGHIQLSADTVALLPPSFHTEPRGSIELRNRGPIATYFLRGRDEPEPPATVPGA